MEEGQFGGDELIRDLARWLADERLSTAVTERSRERSLRDQASASATWLGVLVDLAEGAETVEVTAGGGRRAGRIVGVGADFCVLEGVTGRPALIAVGSMTSVAPTTPGRAAPPAGDRPPTLSLSLAGALSALADQRSPVALTTDDGDTFEGEAVAVGQDVVTLRTGRSRMRHVALVAVAICELR